MPTRRHLVVAAVLLLLNLLTVTLAAGDDKAPPGDGENKNERTEFDGDFRPVTVFEAANRRVGVSIGGAPKILIPIVGPFDEQRQPFPVVTKDGDVLIFYLGHSSSLGVTALFVARVKKGENTVADARGISVASSGFDFANLGAAMDVSPASPFVDSAYVALQVNPIGTPLGEVGILFSRNAGQTWLPTNFTVLNNQRVNFTPSLGIGPDGNLYVSYFDSSSPTPEKALIVETSNDGGKTFTRRTVSSIVPDTQFPHQHPSICPYEPKKVSLMATDCRTGVCQLVHWHSTDGGDTWGPGTRAVPTSKHQRHHRRHCRGQRHAAIFHQTTGVGNLADITYTRTTDGGLNWDSPVRVNDRSLDGGGVFKLSTATYPPGAAPNLVHVITQPSPGTPLDGPRSRGLIPGTPALPVWTALTSLGHTDLFTAGTPPGNALVAAILPASRSVQVGVAATAFVTIINTGATTATAVGMSLLTDIPATFSYRTTDSNNVPVGPPDTPADIPPNSAQTYVIVITPTAPFPPSDILLSFEGTNTVAVRTVINLNTMLASASATPVPDMVALVATPNQNGIVDVPGATGAAAFAVATVNVGASGIITVSADTAGISLPVTLTICQTDPATGFCLAPASSSVQASIGANQTPTFSVFVVGSGIVPFDPANNRIIVIFVDGNGVIRGSTSAAVRTI